MTTIWYLLQLPSKSIHPMSTGYSMSPLFYWFASNSFHLWGWFALISICMCHLSWKYHRNPPRFSTLENCLAAALMRVNHTVWNIYPILQGNVFDVLWMMRTVEGLSVAQHWTIAVVCMSANDKNDIDIQIQADYALFSQSDKKNQFKWIFTLLCLAEHEKRPHLQFNFYQINMLARVTVWMISIKRITKCPKHR